MKKLEQITKKALGEFLPNLCEVLCEELKNDVFVELDGKSHVVIQIWCKTYGKILYEIPLSKLVQDYIKNLGIDGHFTEFYENSAADFADQASKLRIHAAKCRKRNTP